MPSYQYQCPKCHRVEDAIHPAKTRLALRCVACKSPMEWQFPCPNISTDTTFMAGMPEASKRGSGVFNAQMNRVVYGKGDIRNYCEQHGIGCEGVVNVKRRPLDEDPGPYRAADVHVESEVNEIVAAEHGGRVSKRKRGAIKESVAERFAGKQ